MELSKLLPNNSFAPESDKGRIVVKNGEITVQKESQSKQIDGINSWLTAFFIYMDVMLQKFPHMGRYLLHYVGVIRTLAKTPASVLLFMTRILGWPYHTTKSCHGARKMQNYTIWR